jgi:hypothetical protein
VVKLETYEDIFALLHQYWLEALDLNAVDADEDFFALGGDSMKALVVAGRAIEAGLAVPRSAVLRRPTLRSLAEAAHDPRLFDDGEPVYP